MIKQSNNSITRVNFKQSHRQGRQSFPDDSSNKVTNNAAARGRSNVIPITADHLKACKSEPSSIQQTGPYTESECRLFMMALVRCSQQEQRELVARMGLL